LKERFEHFPEGSARASITKGADEELKGGFRLDQTVVQREALLTLHGKLDGDMVQQLLLLDRDSLQTKERRGDFFRLRQRRRVRRG
jgi:hypothetical protein